MSPSSQRGSWNASTTRRPFPYPKVAHTPVRLAEIISAYVNSKANITLTNANFSVTTLNLRPVTTPAAVLAPTTFLTRAGLAPAAPVVANSTRMAVGVGASASVREKAKANVTAAVRRPTWSASASRKLVTRTVDYVV